MKQLTIISLALLLLTAYQANCGIVSDFPYTESFENEYGEWTTYLKPYYGSTTSWWAQWDITNLSSWTSTGPKVAYDGTYFILTKSLPVNGLSPHYLTLTCDFSSVVSPEISFMYFMYGEDMSNLYFNVYAGA